MFATLVCRLGMFCEAYFIFSIGNIGPLLSAEYPQCWKSYKDVSCSYLVKHLPDCLHIFIAVG